MPTGDDVDAFLRNYLKKPMGRGGVRELTAETSLTETGLVDSFGLLELVMAVQEHFQVTVDLGAADPDVFTVYGGFLKMITCP